MFRNGIDSFLEKLLDKDEVVKMCNQVLEIDPRKIGKRKNEDHFCPPKFKERIEGIVQYLIVEKKISRSDVSLFSCSLTLADAILTAALRKQDTLGQLARYLHLLKCQDIHGDAVAITRCPFPCFFKNKKALENSTCGVLFVILCQETSARSTRSVNGEDKVIFFRFTMSDLGEVSLS